MYAINKGMDWTYLGYGQNHRGTGVRLPAEAEIFSSTVIGAESGVYAVCSVKVYGAIFLGVKWAGPQSHHSVHQVLMLEWVELCL
jgi:hypothetical protein